MSRYQYIAFDMDGTLANTLPVVLRTMQQALKECTGRSYAIEDLHFAMGLSNEDTFRQLEIDDPGPCIDRWDELLEETANEVVLFEGIPELLKELKADGAVLGVVTSREPREYEALQDVIRPIAPYLDHIVLCDMTERNKPAPDPMLKFLELSGGTPDKTLFVGDAYCDMECAAAAGVHSALALWGALDPTVKADAYLQKPEDVFNL